MTSVQTQPAQQGSEELISGSEALAIACSLADVDVITAYPIRPYDTVMQYVSKLKADGVTYNTLSGNALTGLKSKLAVFEQRWIAKAKAAGVDGPAALKMFRAEIAAYKKP